MESGIRKNYLYKVRNPQGQLLNIWSKEVITDFQYNQEINSAGPAVDVTLARNPDDIEAPNLTETYKFHFDGSVSIDNTDGWTDPENAFDGDPDTSASVVTPDEFTPKSLSGVGTNAIGVDKTIKTVRVRASIGASEFVTTCDINVNHEAEELVSFESTSNLARTTIYQELSVPTGGWTLEKLKNLEAEITVTSPTTQTVRVRSFELEVIAERSQAELTVNNRVDVFVYYEDSSTLIDHTGDELVTDDNVVLLAEEGASNGRRVFSGYISRIIPNYDTNTIGVTLLPNSTELNNFMLTKGTDPVVLTSNVLDSPDDDTVSQLPFGSFSVAQTFQTDENGNLAYINVPIGLTDESFIGTPDAEIRFTVIEGTPDNQGATLGTGTRTLTETSSLLSLSSVAAQVPTNGVAFDDIPLVIGQDYTLILQANNVSAKGIDAFEIVIYDDFYADGSFWTFSGTNWSELSPGKDTLFNVFELQINTRVPYLSTDPSDILKDIIDNYKGRGGTIGFTDDTIQDTDTLQSLEFNVNTVYEGVGAVLSVTPPVGGWYWYVDVGTNLIHLQPQNTTADHIFTLGNEIAGAEIEQTIEGLANDVFVAGGEDGAGDRIFRRFTDTDSLDNYRRGLVVINDNRLTDVDSMETRSLLEFARNSEPRYRTTITISAARYNIENIRIGQMIGFAGFNTYVDNLLLQISGLRYSPEEVTLSLDSLPPDVNRRIDVIRRSLRQLQTADSPDAPD